MSMRSPSGSTSSCIMDTKSETDILCETMKKHIVINETDSVSNLTEDSNNDMDIENTSGWERRVQEAIRADPTCQSTPKHGGEDDLNIQEMNDYSPEFKENMKRLYNIVDRLDNLKFPEVPKISNTLVKCSQHLTAMLKQQNEQDIELLQQLELRLAKYVSDRGSETSENGVKDNKF